MATAANCGAESDDKAPPNEPMGVRTPETITTSFRRTPELKRRTCTCNKMQHVAYQLAMSFTTPISVKTLH
jgi:hypothetical protein